MIVKKILVSDVKKDECFDLYFSNKCNVGFEIGGYLVYSGDDGNEYDMTGKDMGDCLVYISKRNIVKKVVSGIDKVLEDILG